MKSKSNHRITPLITCLLCIAVNLIGSLAVSQLGIPLYLDSIGTILASCLYGYLPGIIVGFTSNILGGLVDTTNVFYCSISVLLAVASTFLYKKKLITKHVKLFALSLFTIVLALIGGGLGSTLTWFLYGDETTGITAVLSEALTASTGMGTFLSMVTSGFLIDLADKAISVLAVFGFLRAMNALPDEPQANTANVAQSIFPLTKRKRADSEKGTRNQISLRTKVMGFIAQTAIATTGIIALICFLLYREAIIEEESNMAFGVAKTASAAFDSNRIDDYLRDTASKEYHDIEQRLADIASSSGNIQYVYVYQIMEDGCHVIFDPDTEYEEVSDPGTIIKFDDAFLPYVPDLLAGNIIKPVISDESYGWLLSVYLPVTNAKGDCTAYVGVDISMQHLRDLEGIFLARALSIFIGFLVIFLTLGAHFADRFVVSPINAIAKASCQFAEDTENNKTGILEQIQALEIHTHDEIENLYQAVLTTTQDLAQYIQDMKAKNEQISRFQSGLIMVLAELVESRDTCTGNHIRNTAKYVQQILNQMKVDGTYADQLSDDYIREVVTSAPLHDVGKIQVSDLILNKPGKLTDEEYSQMKQHTTAGGPIIESAKDMFDGEEDYLEEAENMALCHHERWDGKGYPNGLEGEEIPLSARVMAVADVYDALVARRSYKEGMPEEKAIEIVKSGSGTQFDPAIVDAFLKTRATEAKAGDNTPQSITATSPNKQN